MKVNEQLLIEVISKNEPIIRVIRALKDLNFPFAYYVGAGCITNTVWNNLSGYPLEYGISDIDIVYYSSEDITWESENRLKDKLSNLLGEFPYKLDVKNQARVHLWYEDRFGFPIKQYYSLEEAIDSWPTTATAIGIRQEQDGAFNIYAPYSLEDLFSLVVRPNKLMITREIYENKVRKWQDKWPTLTVVPWY